MLGSARTYAMIPPSFRSRALWRAPRIGACGLGDYPLSELPPRGLLRFQGDARKHYLPYWLYHIYDRLLKAGVSTTVWEPPAEDGKVRSFFPFMRGSKISCRWAVPAKDERCHGGCDSRRPLKTWVRPAS